ncbi:cytochrome bd-I oxidase subunit CydX [Providencia rettgeri]|uniref:Cytochrome bd-I oxidase subunit CydX n=1 Tax=Providencia rettgeri TaxID=587 RepID=A0A939SPM0_PRORE|nr:cytochrome bd-I oxidase subunit CydX [Providencia rettgeri]
MWYFAWILGTLLACSFVITALALEHVESGKAGQEDI